MCRDIVTIFDNAVWYQSHADTFALHDSIDDESSDAILWAYDGAVLCYHSDVVCIWSPNIYYKSIYNIFVGTNIGDIKAMK